MSDSKCFVNSNCIWCGTCVAVADQLFAIDPASNLAVVVKQPETPEERSSFENAKSSCPVQAIEW